MTDETNSKIPQSSSQKITLSVVQGMITVIN